MENIYKNKMTVYHHCAWFGSDNYAASINLLREGASSLGLGDVREVQLPIAV